MTFRRLVALLIPLLLLVLGVYAAVPYARAASLIVRAADLGGQAEELANLQARAVDRRPPHTVPTRYGEVAAQYYVPEGRATRTILVIPGIHKLGIEEPRLVQLAHDLAATGIRVMTMALPDLRAYRITPNATDTIEDAVAWMADQPALAPDGRIGLAGISFSGGLSIAAASRPAIRDRLAFVFAFGGHGDLPRVMRYLATGEAPQVEGIEIHRPHDYGVAVVLYGLADRGAVPLEQVDALRAGIETFLLASQLTLADPARAERTFAEARAIADTLPEPSRTYLTYVNDRAVEKLGAVLEPHLDQLGADDPSLSAGRNPTPPAAPIYLLHGREDTVIPAVESVLLAEHLRETGADVRLLLSGLITHAEVDHSAAASEAWKLIRFWGDILRQ